MLKHFGKILNKSPMRKGCKKWDWEVYHIRYAYFFLAFLLDKIAVDVLLMSSTWQLRH